MLTKPFYLTNPRLLDAVERPLRNTLLVTRVVDKFVAASIIIVVVVVIVVVIIGIVVIVVNVVIAIILNNHNCVLSMAAIRRHLPNNSLTMHAVEI